MVGHIANYYNECCKEATLFPYGNRKLENIPPSRAALLQHVKHASFQAGYIWGQAPTANPYLPSPSEWGWQKDTTPLRTTLSEASKRGQELVKCNCKQCCLGRCKCHKANLKCTQLCFCDGQMHRASYSVISCSTIARFSTLQ